MIRVLEVDDRKAFRRFLELPFGLHRDEERWVPPLVAVERARLDPARQPFFAAGDGAYLLAWRGGQPVARCSAHVDSEGRGWFGFFDAADDVEVVDRLLDSARIWLEERGCASMTGPASFTLTEEAGVRVEGYDEPAFTAWPWHPPRYAALLEAAGLEPAGDLPAWRLPAGGADALPPVDHPAPVIAGAYGDPRIVVGTPDGERVVAVPDLARGLARRRSGQSAWSLARQARRREWEGCVVLEVVGDPERLLRGLTAAAGAAGYAWVLSPYPLDDPPPTVVHRLFTTAVA